MFKLKEKEIRKRLQKLNNYEKIIYPQLKARSKKLREENKKLKEQLKEKEADKKLIEKLQLELEELRELKFGKKREKKIKAKTLPNKEEERKESKPKKERPKESYKRGLPKKEEITEKVRIEIKKCPECGEELKEKKEHEHYREDLKSVEKLLKEAKKIVKTIIESGKCKKCKKRYYGGIIPSQKVTIGTNVRIMVVYMIIVQGQSYKETQRGLEQQYGIKISSGEITKILEGEQNILMPYYNKILEELETEKSAHYDETSWKTKSRGKTISEGNYCWVKTGIENKKTIIWLGRSRGKRVAEELRGIKKGSIGISDDYGSYRDLFETHQLCWAHPHRKLRDLSESNNLQGKAKKICQKMYKVFAKVYKKSEKAREIIKTGKWTEEKKIKERIKLENLFNTILKTTENDPEKLVRIRKSLSERKARYFTFFEYPDLPLDNNKAERTLRKIVLKRKKSFGCKSQKGANILSVLYSVIFSIGGFDSDNAFFDKYKEASSFEKGL